ncbi:hypothetical protein F5Y17DRAFT_210203 [Xylariaceae sp. FL0594]|nr:hypothetical protein F5Y17DRAFT_210203 [Xylariaceae sp. FL0594]
MAFNKKQISVSIAIGIVCAIAASWAADLLSFPLLSSLHTLSLSAWTRPIPIDWLRDEDVCEPQTYRTEIVSLDPLVIYIHDFFNARDIKNLLKVGKDRFKPSVVHQNGRMVENPYRTSTSAVLPPEDPAVRCVLERSRKFLGTMLDPDGDEMGVPQLVQYVQGQHYNLHQDWMRTPQAAFDGTARTFNRLASFFVILEDGCAGGETWFPLITPAWDDLPDDRDGTRLWHEHEAGGIAFKPVAGNAIFWVNLLANGTGDIRTVHAGLPVTGGLKTAMNIWPRKYTPIPQ